jgi:hypothetical protein
MLHGACVAGTTHFVALSPPSDNCDVERLAAAALAVVVRGVRPSHGSWAVGAPTLNSR